MSSARRVAGFSAVGCRAGAWARALWARLVAEWRLVGIVAALTLQHLWWLSRHRRGVAADFDEAELLGHASRFGRAGLSIGELQAQWTAPTKSAPGLALGTGALQRLLGEGPLTDLAGPILAAALLVVATTSIGRSVGLGRWSELAALVVGTALVVQWFTRAHHQILPATALWALCVALGLRSDLLSRVGPSAALGVAAGVALLTRAMVLPVLASLLLALLFVAARARRFSGETVRNALLATGLAMSIAAPWWALHGPTTLRYLVAAEARHADGGPVAFRIGSEVRHAVATVAPAEAVVQRGVLQPHDQLAALRRDPAGVLAEVGWLGLLSAAILSGGARMWRGDRREACLVVVASTLAVVGVLAAVDDDFPGFATLATPGLVVMASAVARASRLRRLALAALVLLAVSGVLRGFMPGTSWMGRLGADSPGATVSPVRWDDAVEDILAKAPGPGPVVVMGESPLVAAETLEHASRRSGRDLCFERPATEVRSGPDLEAWVDGHPGLTGAVTVARPDSTDALPTSRSAGSLGAALIAQGAAETSTVILPDGWAVTIWSIPGGGSGCG